MKKYEYMTKNGFLTRIKVTTEKTEYFSATEWDKTWLDARHLELLLNLDEVWRTPRQLKKNAKVNVDHADTTKFLKKLVDMGLVERRKPNNAHTEYRRTNSFPKHSMGGI
tara:strand:- start:424 stop:753 length:330 start_codon:yes stop_codon:yes gene_type:complete